jgi:hypothetical protein
MAIGLCVFIAILYLIGFSTAKRLVWEDGTVPNPWKKYAPGAADEAPAVTE